MKSTLLVRIKKIVAIGCLALAAACGEGRAGDGEIGGVVIDAQTGEPIEGATVVLTIGTLREELDSDEDGVFSIGNVPGGEFLLEFRADGYHDASLRDTIPIAGAAKQEGDQAAFVGPIGLLQATESLEVTVSDASGAPVDGYEFRAVVLARYVDFGGGTAASRGQISLTATTDGSGGAVLDELPDTRGLGAGVSSTVLFQLPPYDRDGDGAYDYAGGVQVVDTQQLGAPRAALRLDSFYDTTLRVDAATVPGLRTVAPTADPTVLAAGATVALQFNLPVDPDATSLILQDELGETMAALELTYAGLSATATLPGTLEEGTKYHLELHAVSTVAGVALSRDVGAPFFTPSSAALSVASITDDGGIIDITFNRVIGGTNLLTQANCVLFFDADLDESGTIGDFSGELGASSCSHDLAIVEPSPVGLSLRSDFSKTWRFTPPAQALAGDTVHLRFSRIQGDNEIVIFPGGERASNISAILP